jgi:hypothetical protein
MANMANVTAGELDNELIPNGFYLGKGSMTFRKIYDLDKTVVGTASFDDGGGVAFSDVTKDLQEYLIVLAKREKFLVMTEMGHRLATLNDVNPSELESTMLSEGFYLEGGLLDVCSTSKKD